MTQKVATTFTSATAGTSLPLKGEFNASVQWNGAVGTVQIQRFFEGDSSWRVVKEYANTDGDIEIVLNEPEGNVLYRFQCTAWTSGTFYCRFGQ